MVSIVGEKLSKREHGHNPQSCTTTHLVTTSIMEFRELRV